MIAGSEDFDSWIGHKVVLFRDKTISFGSKLVGGIRVREPRKQTEPDAPEPTDHAESEQMADEFKQDYNL